MKKIQILILIIIPILIDAQNCDSIVTTDKFTKEKTSSFQIRKTDNYIDFHITFSTSKAPDGTIYNHNRIKVNIYKRKFAGNTAFIKETFLVGGNIYFLFSDNSSFKVYDGMNSERSLIGGFNDFAFNVENQDFFNNNPNDLFRDKIKKVKLTAIRIDTVFVQTVYDLSNEKQSCFISVFKCMGQ